MTKSQDAGFFRSKKILKIIGAVLLFKTSALMAWNDLLEPGTDGPIERSFFFFPALLDVPPEESEEPIDPVKVACENVKRLLEDHLNPLPIVDWLNVSNLPSFFEPTIRSLLKREECYNSLDTLGKYSLGVQPYGFYSNFDLEKEKFKLTTFGVNVDGAVTLFDRWVIGAGLGYWHSNLDWGKKAKKNLVNSVYGGPFGGYIFDQAYVGLTLLGVYNFYQVNSLFVDGKDQSHHGWDLGARLEGGYDYEWSRYFGKDFFIQPNGEISYLFVSQNKMEETKALSKEKELSAVVDSRTYNFMRYRLGVTLKKEFHDHEKGILIPSLSIAWVLMQPLSTSNVKFKCGESDPQTVKHEKYPRSNQLYLGAKVVAINTRALMLSIGADVYIAHLYPVYAGNLRFESSW